MDIILKNQILAPISMALKAVQELEGIPDYITVTIEEAVQVLEDLHRAQKEREYMQIEHKHGTADPRLTIYAKNFDKPAAESIADKWRQGIYTFVYRGIPVKIEGFERYENSLKIYPF